MKGESKIDVPLSPLWKPSSQEMAKIQIFIMGATAGLDKPPVLAGRFVFRV